VTTFEIREMIAADIEQAVAMYKAGGWGERREYLEWMLATPGVQTLVGVRDGSVVATGMASIHGDVGWVGSIFVDRTMRSQGYGRALTEAAIERIDAAGCRTQALIASEFGKPLYDTMGFRVDAQYQILEAEPLVAAPAPPPAQILRPMTPGDVDGACALDRRATGEDRRALITSLAGSGWVLTGADGAGTAEGNGGPAAMRGFLVSILADSATVIAPDFDDAAVLLEQLRWLGLGHVKTVKAAVPDVHDAGRHKLEARGWSPTFQTPRMLRGPAIDWDPTLIWSILSFGFG